MIYGGYPIDGWFVRSGFFGIAVDNLIFLLVADRAE